MDAFSLLKFWRNGGTVGGISRILTRDGCSTAPTTGTTTILTAVTPLLSDSDSDLDSDGPFIDLEFTSAPEDEHGRINGRENDDGENSDQVKHNNEQHAAEEVDGSESDESSYNENEEGELNLTFSTSSGSSVDRTDPYGYLSPSDDLFCKGGDLFPVNDSETNSKFQASLVKTATKFRVLMLKLKKAKATNAEQKAEKSQSEGSNPAKPRLSQKQIKAENEKNESQIRTEKSSLTVRFKVEELNIIKSLFIRDTTSKNGNNGGIAAEGNSHSNVDPSSSPSSCPDEKKFSKELMMEKYLKMVKPLYVRVSRRYGEKLRFSGQLSLSRGGGGIKAASVSSAPPPQSTMEQTQKGETAPAVEISENTSVLSYAKSVKQGSLPAGLRVVRKHLVKSRSAPPAAVSSGQVSSRRRDDSLYNKKMEFKAPFYTAKDSNLRVLSRSTSEASQGNPVNFPGDEIEPVSQSG